MGHFGKCSLGHPERRIEGSIVQVYLSTHVHLNSSLWRAFLVQGDAPAKHGITRGAPRSDVVASLVAALQNAGRPRVCVHLDEAHEWAEREDWSRSPAAIAPHYRNYFMALIEAMGSVAAAAPTAIRFALTGKSRVIAHIVQGSSVKYTLCRLPDFGARLSCTCYGRHSHPPRWRPSPRQRCQS